MTGCPSPYNRSHRPCYNRRCSCQDCRNKAAWKEYTTLIRSCLRLPPTHFITLNTPWLYYGWNSTQLINRFVKALRRLLPRGHAFAQVWRYDPNTQGRFPHVHMLVRTDATISPEAVAAAWSSVWPDEEVDSHIRPVDDVYGAVVYFTKHGDDQKRILKAEWQGRTCGGDRKFYCNTKKSLFTDSHYRQDYDDALMGELQARLERDYPQLMGMANTPSARITENKIGSTVPYSLLHLYRPPFRKKRFTIKCRRRPCNPHPMLRYCIWIVAPP